MRVPPPPRAIFLGGPGVHYSELPFPEELAPWVAAVWLMRVEREHVLRVLPDGCVDLIRGDVVGPSTRAVVVTLSPGEETIGVRLRPGAFPALFGVPAGEVRDARVPLGELVARPRPLRALAADAPAPDPLAAAALNASDVRALARDAGYSERQLRRRLEAATGHGPKRLARIGRMQALLSAGRGESWARAAAEHGFYDEAHMANDVRSLAGATPHEMLGDGRFLQGGRAAAA